MSNRSIYRTVCLSLLGGFALITAAPAIAEIPLTGGEVQVRYRLSGSFSTGYVESFDIVKFNLVTPKGTLASPQATVEAGDAERFFDDFGFEDQLPGKNESTLNISGVAFTPEGEVVMFSKVPTLVKGQIQGAKEWGQAELAQDRAIGTVIVNGGAFNFGSSTVTSTDGRTFDDSTLSFEVISTGVDKGTSGEVVTIDGSSAQDQERLE